MPVATASRRATVTSAESAPRIRSSALAWDPNATSSGAARIASTSSAVSAPRSAACRRPARTPTHPDTAGTARPPTSSPAASTRPAAGRTAAAAPTDSAPANTATTGGWSARR